MKKFLSIILPLAFVILGATAQTDTNPHLQSGASLSATQRHQSGPLVDNATGARAPNIVKVTKIPKGCKALSCRTTVTMHNSRVDAGASFVSSQISGPALTSSAQFIALSSDTAAVAKTDTTCPSELTTNGMGRKIATYAYVTAPSTLNGTATYTLSNSYSATGAYTINKLCLFTAISGPTLLFETLLGGAVTGGNGDTVNVVWTVNA